jgi:hypothetical protein
LGFAFGDPINNSFSVPLDKSGITSLSIKQKFLIKQDFAEAEKVILGPHLIALPNPLKELIPDAAVPEFNAAMCHEPNNF